MEAYKSDIISLLNKTLDIITNNRYYPAEKLAILNMEMITGYLCYLKDNNETPDKEILDNLKSVIYIIKTANPTGTIDEISSLVEYSNYVSGQLESLYHY